jgi:hypothetical protein
MILSRRKRARRAAKTVRPQGGKRNLFRRPFLELLESRLVLDGGLAASPIVANYLSSPLSFEANRGQADLAVQFLSRGHDSTLFLTPAAANLSLYRPDANDPTATGQSAVLRMQRDGANPAPHLAALDPLADTSNYLLGNDSSRWQVGVPNFGRVEERQVYDGIDLIFHGCQRQVEYDFVDEASADPGQISIHFDGQNGTEVDAQGNLVLHTAAGGVVEQAPTLYQEVNGVRQAVSGGYVLRGGGSASAGRFRPADQCGCQRRRRLQPHHRPGPGRLGRRPAHGPPAGHRPGRQYVHDRRLLHAGDPGPHHLYPDSCGRDGDQSKRERDRPGH